MEGELPSSPCGRHHPVTKTRQDTARKQQTKMARDHRCKTSSNRAHKRKNVKTSQQPPTPPRATRFPAPVRAAGPPPCRRPRAPPARPSSPERPGRLHLAPPAPPAAARPSRVCASALPSTWNACCRLCFKLLTLTSDVRLNSGPPPPGGPPDFPLSVFDPQPLSHYLVKTFFSVPPLVCRTTSKS